MMKLSVHSSLIGQLIKARDLPLSTVFNVSDTLNFQVNANQLLVWVRLQSDDQQVLLLYDLETLLSQAADIVISPRVLEIGEPGLNISRIYLNKTSISVVLQRTRTGKVDKIITLDFRKSKN